MAAMKRRMLTALLVCGVLGWAAGVGAVEAKAAATYDVTLKGTSNTLDGQKFPFTATGVMTWDQTTGAVTFTATTSVGVTFTGAGILARGAKASYALTTFDSGFVTGSAVFLGKFSTDGAQFSGKFQAGSPNRLGQPPGGFVYTTGSIKALRR
jgi:hypothetical protein